MSGDRGTAGIIRASLALLRRHAGRVYAVALAVTLVNTVPDVLRQLLVYRDPSLAHGLAVPPDRLRRAAGDRWIQAVAVKA